MGAMAEAPKRQRLRPEVRREQLLDAATQVFAERGYEGARVEQIADAAHVSPGLLYRHFDGKQDLYAEILQLANRELMQHLAQAAAPQRPSSERVREGLDAFFTFVEDHRHLWQMLMKDVVEPEIAEIREQVTARSVRAVAALAAQDYDAGPGQPGELELEMAAVMIVGSAVSLASWWTDHPEVSRAKMVGVAMDVMWLGLERVRAGDRYAAGS
jgi:AcrR family transcriptional regulator